MSFLLFIKGALGPDCSRLGISESTFTPQNSSLTTDNVSNQGEIKITQTCLIQGEIYIFFPYE